MISDIAPIHAARKRQRMSILFSVVIVQMQGSKLIPVQLQEINPGGIAVLVSAVKAEQQPVRLNFPKHQRQMLRTALVFRRDIYAMPLGRLYDSFKPVNADRMLWQRGRPVCRMQHQRRNAAAAAFPNTAKNMLRIGLPRHSYLPR